MSRMTLYDESGHKRTLCNCKYQKIERGKYKVFSDRFRIGMIIVGDDPSEIQCEKTADATDANITIDSAGTYNIKDSFGKTICTIKVNNVAQEVPQDASQDDHDGREVAHEDEHEVDRDAEHEVDRDADQDDQQGALLKELMMKESELKMGNNDELTESSTESLTQSSTESSMQSLTQAPTETQTDTQTQSSTQSSPDMETQTSDQ